MDGPEVMVVPPGVLFRMLSLLWCLVSPGALFLLLRDRAWTDSPGVVATLRAVRLEQWIAVVLLVLHLWFVWRWWRAARRVAPDRTRLLDA